MDWHKVWDLQDKWAKQPSDIYTIKKLRGLLLIVFYCQNVIYTCLMKKTQHRKTVCRIETMTGYWLRNRNYRQEPNFAEEEYWLLQP